MDLKDRGCTKTLSHPITSDVKVCWLMDKPTVAEEGANFVLNLSIMIFDQYNMRLRVLLR